MIWGHVGVCRVLKWLDGSVYGHRGICRAIRGYEGHGMR